MNLGSSRAISRAVSVGKIVIIIIAAAGGIAFYYSTSPGSSSTTTPTTTHTTTTTSSSSAPITIGMITPLSGTYTQDGTLVQEGAQMAIDQINSNGGVLGRSLNLIAQDEGATTADTVNAAQILVNQDNVSFMIGPYFSGDVLSVLPLTSQHKVIEMLSVASVDSFMTSPQNTYMFRTTLDDAGYANLAIQWLKAIHATTFMFEAEDFKYTHEVGNQTSALASQNGLTVASQDFYDASATDYSSAINKIAAVKPDAVVVIMEGTNGISFQQQYAANPVTSKIPVLHLETLLQIPANAQSVDTSAPGGMNDVFVAPTNTITNVTSNFASQFQQKYGTTASNYAMDAYASVMMLAQAIKNAGSLNTDKVASSLAAVEYLGPGGVYKFQSNHNPYIGTGYLTGTIYQVAVSNSGQLHYSVVWPPSAANATAINPATGQPFT